MHMKLMASTFQNLFHRIGVHKVNLNTIKRCLLVNYNAYSQELESSHYMFRLQSHSCGRKSWDEEASPEVLQHEPPAQQQELLATGVVLADREVMHIQEGVEEQSVLFHNFMHKTLQELQATLAAKSRGALQREEEETQGKEKEKDEAEYFCQMVVKEPNEDLFLKQRQPAGP
ncbi:Suppressor of SWI4 1 like protein [Pteropus alecto]|uniref:Suppressor of SWI4 1 like protein n=1 Tax=Pteropus alecto TaxID=9402 RepID=L5KX59_PTEAL|nr:Suppressor of SWI4 1 like protein [Pteropus alecto]